MSITWRVVRTPERSALAVWIGCRLGFHGDGLAQGADRENDIAQRQTVIGEDR